ncbi:MAG: hypothetical protein KDC38_08550, partial [Planctomycetes bacterium]|nr:hypothetical protein [Planctomycetota bacterium]
GDIFFVGQAATDPGFAATIKERVVIDTSELEWSFDTGLVMEGTRTFTRMLEGGSELTYAEDFTFVQPALAVAPSIDAPTYAVGDSIVVTATVVDPVAGALFASQAVVIATLQNGDSTASAEAVLHDDGLGVDAIAADGVYTAALPVTAEVLCGGPDPEIVVTASRYEASVLAGANPIFNFGRAMIEPTILGPAAGADLAPRLVDWPAEAQTESDVNLVFEVANLGETTSVGSFAAQVWLSADETLSGDDVLLFSEVHDDIVAGDAAILGGTIALPSAPAGEVFLIYAIDPFGQVVECDETNNQFAFPMSVVDAFPFRRGDANGDGGVDISDAIHTLSELFTGGSPSLCDDATDANDDGAKDLSDAIYALSALFVGGPPPPFPYPGCGQDPSLDGLSCEAYGSCP